MYRSRLSCIKSLLGEKLTMQPDPDGRKFVTNTVCLCRSYKRWNVVVVCSGVTSLSTIFQSYHDGVWLRHGGQCSLL